MDNHTEREINKIFRELLDEYCALKELYSDKSEDALRQIHKEYEDWMDKFYEVQ